MGGLFCLMSCFYLDFTSPEEAQLLEGLLLFKRIQVLKNLLRLMHNAMLQAVMAEKVHQVFVVRAAQYVLRAVGANISFLHSGKVPIKLVIEVLSVSLAKRHSHAKVDDAAHLGLGAVLQNPRNIFFCIIDEGEYGAKPYHRRYSCIAQAEQNVKPFPCGTYVGFQLFAQLFIVCGQGYLNYTLGLFMYFLKQVDVAQYSI